MIYAYLRVSSDKQDEDNQKLGVDELSENLNLKIEKYIIDHSVSGTVRSENRNLGILLKKAKEGDVIIVSELTRISRKIFELFSILDKLKSKGVSLYSVKEHWNLDDSICCKVLAFAYGLSGEIERNMISERTKESLRKKRNDGIKLGRPVGSKTKQGRIPRLKQKVIDLYSKCKNKSKVSRKLHLSIKTVRKIIRETEQ